MVACSLGRVSLFVHVLPLWHIDWQLTPACLQGQRFLLLQRVRQLQGLRADETLDGCSPVSRSVCPPVGRGGCPPVGESGCSPVDGSGCSLVIGESSLLIDNSAKNPPMFTGVLDIKPSLLGSPS